MAPSCQSATSSIHSMNLRFDPLIFLKALGVAYASLIVVFVFGVNVTGEKIGEHENLLTLVSPITFAMQWPVAALVIVFIAYCVVSVYEQRKGMNSDKATDNKHAD